MTRIHEIWHQMKYIFAVMAILLFIKRTIEIFFLSTMIGTDSAFSWHISKVNSHLNWILVFGWGIGWICFTVDAFMRSYKEDKTTAIAIAIFPVTTIFYFLIWGRYPLFQKTSIYNTEFCDICCSQSSSDSAPDTAIINLVVGTRFLGNSSPCEKCGSSVRTLWGLVIFPLFPGGSYRVLYISENRYISRKTNLNIAHVISIYATALAVGLPVLILLFA